MNDQRIPIKSVPCDTKSLGFSKGKVIYLRREGTSEGGEYFKINSVIGAGGSCVCYDATAIGEGKTGRLKEFYPTECAKYKSAYTLERNEKNQLVASKETASAFNAEREEYVSSYHILREVMEKNKNNSDFTGFIPDFSIYYAADEKGDFIDGSTAYIWTAPENLTVFEKYIEDLRKHPTVYPEHKLFTVLKTVLTLTECIKIMHENGLLHLDIKPANFGIPKRTGRLLTDSITLFDVNTIYSMNGSYMTEFGTVGFTAPEVATGDADNTSDIYSIGCTLFSALIASDEISETGYSAEYYTRLEELLDSSKLITASETNSNVFLKHELITILRKCLAESGKLRYQSCVDLVRDLERALAYLYPAEINANLPIGKQLVILEKELDKKKGVSSSLKLMYHLYKKPLFEFLSPEDETLDVLVVGFGNYGQKFLDCCLQVGQMLDKQLNVKVVSNDRAEGKRDKDLYLSARPEIENFFNIDGKTVDEPYGSITFENREFVREGKKKNKEQALWIASEYSRAKYVFVALGDDALNKSVAKAIASTSKEMSVNFAYDGARIVGKTSGNPLYMSEDVSEEPLYKEIERMALNAHLIWSSLANEDPAKSKDRFKEPYYYNASFSNAIAVKYKMFSFGIAMDDIDAAATEFYKKVVPQSKQVKNRMIAAEHRRWVCEKIVNGWTRKSDLESCITGPTNDRKAKKHVCIVRSRDDSTLNTPEWTLAKWDNATEEDLLELDELDRLSVRLHQRYKKAADRLRRESTLLDSSMLQLRSLIKKNPKTSIAFSEWFSCLLLIWNGNDNPVRDYEKLKNVFTDSIGVLNPEDQVTAKLLMKLIEGRLDIILKSMRYTDYKKHDAHLVNYIPYILTHRKGTHLAVPFSPGSNTEMFANVAAATVVNPAVITYLYHVNKARELELFEEAVDYVINYLAEKGIHSKLNFIITHRKDNKLRDEIGKLKATLVSSRSSSRIQKIVVRESESDFAVASIYTELLSDPKFKISAAEQNETLLSYLLLGAGFYAKFPHYQFDINTRKFHSTVNCDFLKFIKANQYLKISDMFASKNSKGYLESPAAFYNDYDLLWKKAYRKKEMVWKRMCGILSDYHEEKDRIISVGTDVAKDKESYVKYRFLVPFTAYEGARRLISAMSECKIFDKKSEVYYYTADSCEVNIYAPRSIEGKVKKLFSDPGILCQPDNIDIVKTPFSVTVSFDSLKVEGVELKNAGKHGEKIKELLRMLESDFAFITAYDESDDGQRISFTYATKRIKKLLTNAGNILEVYVYHKCLKSDVFDDVATGYEINWDGTPVKSEFDIIITKGFAGLLIEAKATESIDQDYYFKLSSLASQFGTNCRPVLIADTVEKDYYDNSGNDMQRLRGNMLDVITISGSSEIDNIDRTLAKLLNAEPSVTEKTAAPKKPTAVQTATTREEYLSRKISELKLDQSLTSILVNHGVKTLGDFLEQTEESFDLIRGKNKISHTAKLMLEQENLKKRLEDLFGQEKNN